MSRSGTHAIIDWLLAQCSGRFCFLNCAEPKQNPFSSARVLEEDRVYRANYPGFNLRAEAQGRFSRKNLLLYSYEDAQLGAVTNSEWERGHDSLVGTSERRINILILRDPFNLLASRIRSGLYDNRYIWGQKVVTNKMAMRIWKQHAREIAGKRRRLPAPTVHILYNDWARSQAHRRSILHQIGLPMLNDRILHVPRVADGSSFDGLSMDGEPGRMAVHERWKQFMDDPNYINCFDDQVLELSDAIFGPLPAAQAVARRQASLRA
jgi:hypothetical protein